MYCKISGPVRRLSSTQLRIGGGNHGLVPRLMIKAERCTANNKHLSCRPSPSHLPSLRSLSLRHLSF